MFISLAVTFICINGVIFGSVLVVFRRSEKRNREIQDGVHGGSKKVFFNVTEIQRIIRIISRHAIKLFFIITSLLYELQSLSFKPAPSHSLSGSKKTKTRPRLNRVMCAGSLTRT